MDLMYLLRKILKKGTKLDISEAFHDELYEELIEVIKVSEGKYDHLLGARDDAAKVDHNPTMVRS